MSAWRHHDTPWWQHSRQKPQALTWVTDRKCYLLSWVWGLYVIMMFYSELTLVFVHRSEQYFCKWYVPLNEVQFHPTELSEGLYQTYNNNCEVFKGATSSFVHFEKKLSKLFKIVISNPRQSSPSSAILIPFCFRIFPLVFFFPIKPLFWGFPALKPYFRPSTNWLKISWRGSLNSRPKTIVILDSKCESTAVED